MCVLAFFRLFPWGAAALATFIFSFGASMCLSVTLDEANAAYLAGDFEKAMSIATPLAAGGNAEAQLLVGVMCRDGKGVSKDVRRAFEMFERAAENGNVAAQFNVGKAYQDGQGTRRDYIRARYWYERADATQARDERAARPLDDLTRSGGKMMNRLPDGCRPARPPFAAMSRFNLRQLSGSILFFVDAEGKVRGVTHQAISEPELRYEAVAFFSESLRSKDCEIDPAFRDRRMVIPFRFEVTGW